jgi:hypothetical protein
MATQVPSLHIVAGSGGDADVVIDLPSGFDQVLGRDATADITLADPAISRRHARLYRGADGVWLEDLGSTNGTYINGDRLTVPYRLRNGDEIKLGNSLASFHEVVSGADATQVIATLDVPSAAAAPGVKAASPQLAAVLGAHDPGVVSAEGAPRGAPEAPAVDTLDVLDVSEAGPLAVSAAAAASARQAVPVVEQPAGSPPAPDRIPAASPEAGPGSAPAASPQAAPGPALVPGPQPAPAWPGAGTDVGPQVPAAAHQAPVSGSTCPDCFTNNRSGAWFCSQCGRQLRAIPLSAADQGPSRGHSRPLMTVHGDFRRQEFRQAMRTRNGGRRVPYNESLAIPTIVFRGFAVLLLVAVAVFGLVILNDGVHRVFGL